MIIGIFKDILKMIRRHWVAVPLVTLLTLGVTSFIGGSSSYLTPSLVNRTGYILFTIRTIMGLLGGVFFEGIMVQVACLDARKERQDHGKIIRRIVSRLPKLFLIALIGDLIILAGAVLLIVPGIIFTVWYMLIIPVAVLEESRRIPSVFHRSKALVKGHFWQVLAIIGVIILPFVAIDWMFSEQLLFASWPNLALAVSGRFLSGMAIVQIYLRLAGTTIDSAVSLDHPACPERFFRGQAG